MKKHQYSLYVGGAPYQWDKSLVGRSKYFVFPTASSLLNNLFMPRSRGKNRVLNSCNRRKDRAIEEKAILRSIVAM